MFSNNARQRLRDVLDVVNERADTLLREAQSAREIVDDVARYAFRRVREQYFGIPADPVVAILNAFILELGNEFIEMKKDTACAIADEKRLAKEVELHYQKVVEFEQRAMAAAQGNDDLLVREALARKREHEEFVAAFRAQWEKQKALTTELKTILIRTNQVIEKTKRVSDRLRRRRFVTRANELKNQVDRMEQLVKSLSLFADLDGLSTSVDEPVPQNRGD